MAKLDVSVALSLLSVLYILAPLGWFFLSTRYSVVVVVASTVEDPRSWQS